MFFTMITRKHNHMWAGLGKVISIDLNLGIVLVEMLTGKEKGHVGGFDLDKLKFKKVPDKK